MRILIVHNRYRPTAPSGENAVVDQESAALRRGRSRGRGPAAAQRGDRLLVARCAGPPCRPGCCGASSRAGPSARRWSTSRPDVVHLHNTFPLLTPSVLYACRDAARSGRGHDPQLQAGLCQRQLLPRRPGLPRLPGRGAPSRLWPTAATATRAAATLPIVVGSRMHAAAWRQLVSAYIFISAAQRDLLAPRRPAAGAQLRQAQLRSPALGDRRGRRAPGRLRRPARRGEGRLVPDAGLGRFPRPASPVAAPARGGRWRRDGGGGRALGGHAPQRADGRPRVATRGIPHPGRLAGGRRSLAVGGDLRHGGGRGDGCRHGPDRVRPRRLPGTDHLGVGRGALPAHGRGGPRRHPG